jgi:hypothetical protein
MSIQSKQRILAGQPGCRDGGNPMFVRVTHMDIASDNWDEAVQRFRTRVVSELEKQPCLELGAK